MTGEKWESPCGRVVLYCGDCLDVLPTIGNVDALVTDPPYGVNGGSGTIGKASRKTKYEGSFEDTPEYVKRVCSPAVHHATLMARSAAVTPGPVCVWLYPQPVVIGSLFQPAATGLCKWGRCTTQPVLFYGIDPRAGKTIVPIHYTLTERAEENGHPCPKPIGAVAWMVERVSLPNETVIDLFMGSGTTGVAAVKLGRRFIGIEKEPAYFEIAKRRIMDALGMEVSVNGVKQRRMFT